MRQRGRHPRRWSLGHAPGAGPSPALPDFLDLLLKRITPCRKSAPGPSSWLCPNDLPAADIGSHSWFGYLEVDDIEALYAEFTARGATCSAPFDQHYRMREMVVTTVDGHRIVFAQPRRPPG